MDREWKELLEQKLLIFSKREDIERLRQEVLAHFYKLRAEYMGSILHWLKEMKESIEKLKEEWKTPQWESPLQEFGKEVGEIQRQLQGMKGEFEIFSERLRSEIGTHLQRIREESVSQIAYSNEGIQKGLQVIQEAIKTMDKQIREAVEEKAILSEKLREGFEGVKEELGSMIRFSYADLEKRLNALEARVKALEKMVLP